MCPDCRERYLEARGNRENLQTATDPGDNKSSLKAPDLLDIIDQGFNGMIFM
jgi:hypothetical protein